MVRWCCFLLASDARLPAVVDLAGNRATRHAIAIGAVVFARRIEKEKKGKTEGSETIMSIQYTLHTSTNTTSHPRIETPISYHIINNR
jgi:hypothetical protein